IIVLQNCNSLVCSIKNLIRTRGVLKVIDLKQRRNTTWLEIQLLNTLLHQLAPPPQVLNSTFFGPKSLLVKLFIFKHTKYVVTHWVAFKIKTKVFFNISNASFTLKSLALKNFNSTTSVPSAPLLGKRGTPQRDTSLSTSTSSTFFSSSSFSGFFSSLSTALAPSSFFSSSFSGFFSSLSAALATSFSSSSFSGFFSSLSAALAPSSFFSSFSVSFFFGSSFSNSLLPKIASSSFVLNSLKAFLSNSFRGSSTSAATATSTVCVPSGALTSATTSAVMVTLHTEKTQQKNENLRQTQTLRSEKGYGKPKNNI
ncbi:hypothetical protein Lal_00043854, partial [Lupinus albus]